MFPISKYTNTLLLSTFAVLAVLQQGYWLPAANVVTWDVYGYYSWLVGLFGKGHFFEMAECQRLFAEYPISGGEMYQVYPTEGGHFVPIYSIGMAMLYLPFFLLGHLFAAILPGVPADGLSAPYQWAMVLGSLVYAGLGLHWARKLLLHFCSDRAAAFTLLALGLGTNYLNYIAFDNGMPHTYLMSLYAGLMWYTLRWHEQPSTQRAVAVSSMVALLALSRPTEAISIIIPLLYGVTGFSTLKWKLSLLRQHWRQVAAAFVVALCWVFPQMLLWKILVGHWWFNAYATGGHFFEFSHPHLQEGLFGYRKGWLVYTPVMALSILGMLFLWGKGRRFFWPVLLFSILNIYIVLSWHIWWYASCFGMRALIQSYGVLLLPLGLCLAWGMERAPKWARWFIPTVALLCVALNLFQTWQYRHDIIPQDNNNAVYYWRSFLKTSVPQDDKKYLETNEYLPNAESYCRILLAGYDADLLLPNNKPMAVMAGKRAELVGTEQFSSGTKIVLDAQQAAELSGNWVQVVGNVVYQGDSFGDWDVAKLVCSTERGETNLKYAGVAFQRYTPEGVWSEFSYPVHLPTGLGAGDVVNCYVYNLSRDSIGVRGIRLELFKACQ